MSICRILYCLIYFVIHSTCYGHVINISHLSEIIPELHKADRFTLVLFDAEDVLITPSENYNLNYPVRQQLIKKYKNTVPEDRLDYMMSVIIKDRTIQFVDKDTWHIFEYLKKHSIPSTVLTKGRTRHYGTIQNMMDFRINELERIGLDFRDLSPFTNDMELPRMLRRDSDQELKTPMIKHGIIFTAGVDKGQALEAVFKKYNFYPKQIIFIDDKLKNLQSIESLAHKLHIKFIGYEYTGVQDNHLPKLNQKKEEECFMKLERQGIWCYN
jgi:hydroxymethylpyrimidine pyrophosphatase-like HAD family hydrolase